MQPLAQGEENEGAGLMRSMDRCQVWKSSSKTPISTHQQYKEKKKLRLHQFCLSQAELSKILYSTISPVMLNVMMALGSYMKT